MKQEAIKGVDELKNVVKKETIGAQDALEEKIAREYAKVDDEIKEYKKKKVNSLNKKVYELLSNIYTEVIGQDLDQVKHEKLIIELLEKELSKSGLKNNS
jgi:F0F1-type ATP synthase membrane subunit b/b'